MGAKYEDPILRKLKDLLDEYGPKELRGRWSIGDSLNLSAGSLPRGFISYDAVEIDNTSNATIREMSAVVISVAVDMKKEFNSSVDRSDSHEQVIALIAARNEDLSFKNESVVGCLMKHQDLDSSQNLWINTDGATTEVDYGVGIEKRGPGIVTAEGLVRIMITHDQLTPSFG